jgi:hypothetical protein
LGLHVGQVDDGAVVGNESGGQGQEGVFHPKTLLGGLLKRKQHAFALGHVGAVHQTGGALIGGGGNLHLHLVHAGLQLNAGQLKLWLTLCPGQRTQAPPYPHPFEMIHKTSFVIRE